MPDFGRVPSPAPRMEKPEMAQTQTYAAPPGPGYTGVVVLADGSVFWGHGLGAEGDTVGEVCFNTSMTGYQESLTDPSFAGQIITFTFPHIEIRRASCRARVCQSV